MWYVTVKVLSNDTSTSECSVPTLPTTDLLAHLCGAWGLHALVAKAGIHLLPGGYYDYYTCAAASGLININGK